MRGFELLLEARGLCSAITAFEHELYAPLSDQKKIAAEKPNLATRKAGEMVLEVINGIAFLTPLWWFMRTPRVALVHHVHQDHYVAELGRRGKLAAIVLEYLPLRFL